MNEEPVEISHKRLWAAILSIGCILCVIGTLTVRIWFRSPFLEMALMGGGLILSILSHSKSKAIKQEEAEATAATGVTDDA